MRSVAKLSRAGNDTASRWTHILGAFAIAICNVNNGEAESRQIARSERFGQAALLARKN